MSNEGSDSGTNSTVASSQGWSEPGSDKPPVPQLPAIPEAPPLPVWETPLLSETAEAFLEGIDPQRDYRFLMFDDNLATFSDKGEQLGKFKISIKPTLHQHRECYIIEADSHGAVDGVPCGTSIVCYADAGLRTLEQNHHEYVRLSSCPLDRRTTFVRQEDNSLVVNRIVTQGIDSHSLTKTFTEEEMKGFMSEGSNLLLHRLMVQRVNFSDSFEMITLDSELNLCPAYYKKLEERTQTVAGVDLLVYGISRTVVSPADLPTTWQSYFTPDTHLSHRAQVGSPVTMKLVELPRFIVREEEAAKPRFGMKPLDWRNDMQLYSMYLDKVEELKATHWSYLRRHPELQDLMYDFLQFLMQRKPDDIIHFAAEFFAAFRQYTPLDPPYLTSETPNRFPESRTTSRMKQLREINRWAPTDMVHGCTSEELDTLRSPKPMPNFLW